MISADHFDVSMAKMLRKIERDVLAEVPLQRRAVTKVSASTAVLLAASVGAWMLCVGTTLSTVAVATGFAAAVASTVALLRRRFLWCWLASAISGIGVPLSVLGFWSLQTGEPGRPCYWLLVSAICQIHLVANWVQCGLPPQRRMPSPSGVAHPRG